MKSDCAQNQYIVTSGPNFKPFIKFCCIIELKISTESAKGLGLLPCILPKIPEKFTPHNWYIIIYIFIAQWSIKSI